MWSKLFLLSQNWMTTMDKPQRQMNVGFLSFRYITKTTNKGQEIKRKNEGEKTFWRNFLLKNYFFFNDLHVTFGPEGTHSSLITLTGLKKRGLALPPYLKEIVSESTEWQRRIIQMRSVEFWGYHIKSIRGIIRIAYAQRKTLGVQQHKRTAREKPQSLFYTAIAASYLYVDAQRVKDLTKSRQILISSAHYNDKVFFFVDL